MTELTLETACCQHFFAATDYGTDNDGYEALVLVGENSGQFFIGNGLPAMCFCPWCGKRVSD